jgi:hypothetical protein
MKPYTYVSRPAGLLGSLAAMLTLTACPDEGIVDPFASSDTDGSSTGADDGDGGTTPSTMTASTMSAGPDDSTSTGEPSDTSVSFDSTDEGGTTEAVDESSTGMVVGDSSSTGEPGSSSEEGSSSDDGTPATLCPVEVITELPFSVNESITGEDDEFAGSCGGNGAPDHGYTVVAPADGYYVFDTYGSSFDTVLYELYGE